MMMGSFSLSSMCPSPSFFYTIRVPHMTTDLPERLRYPQKNT
jgi:hypothetical protein